MAEIFECVRLVILAGGIALILWRVFRIERQVMRLDADISRIDDDLDKLWPDPPDDDPDDGEPHPEERKVVAITSRRRAA